VEEKCRSGKSNDSERRNSEGEGLGGEGLVGGVGVGGGGGGVFGGGWASFVRVGAGNRFEEADGRAELLV